MKALLKKLILNLTPRALKMMYRQDDGVVSYSQQGEDIAIERFFQWKPEGFYVDVGAFHPITYSNTYKFYQRGWKGINIEPNPDSIARFNEVRPNDINLNFGISSSKQTLSYYKFNEPALNSFSKEHAEAWAARPGFKLEATLKVETFPLSEVLEKHLPKGQPIDFMSIDVEGLDLQVLQSNDWNRFRPRLLVVEESIYGYTSLAESPIISYLAGQGYNLCSVSGGTILLEDKRA